MKTKNYLFSLTVVILSLFCSSAMAQLIIYEPASDAVAAGTNLSTPTYVLDATSPDPDGGLNDGLGLPYTNVGGTPSGTSTGLRANWGGKTKVVQGLTYENNGRKLNTTGNALLNTASGWGDGPVYVYKMASPAVDPFQMYRATSNVALFGWNGTPFKLYFSMLVKLNSLSTGINSNYVSIGFRLNNNVNKNTWIGQTPDGNWSVLPGENDQAIIKPAVAGITTLIVGSINFNAADNTTMDLWVDPLLGVALGVPDLAGTVIPYGNEFLSVQMKSEANNMTFDEFRIGVTPDDVLPTTTTTSLKSTSSSFAVYQSASNIVVDLKGMSGAQTISIFDVQGRNVITRQAIGGSILSMDNNLKNGLYIVKVQGAGNPSITKMVLR